MIPQSLVDAEEDEEALLVSDYSSLEIGIQGDLTYRLFGDEQIIKKYEAQGRGVDMHSNNARDVFGTWLKWTVPDTVLFEGKHVKCPYAGKTAEWIPVEEFKKHPFGAYLRSMIKAIWYGLTYGKGAYGFSTLPGADGKPIGEELAGAMVGALLDAVPGMRKWFAWVEEFVRKWHGIYSLGGRWCDLSEEMLSKLEWMIRRAFRRAYNFPMQATGAEIIGDAMVRVGADVEWSALGFKVCLQVHDELVARGPKKRLARATEILTGHMLSATANGTKLLVPLQVGTGSGSNYYDAK